MAEMELEQLRSYANYKLGEISTWKFISDALDAAVEYKEKIDAGKKELADLDKQIEAKRQNVKDMEEEEAKQTADHEAKIKMLNDKSMNTLDAAVDKAESYRVQLTADIKRLEVQQANMVNLIGQTNTEYQDSLKLLNATHAEYDSVMKMKQALKDSL